MVFRSTARMPLPRIKSFLKRRLFEAGWELRRHSNSVQLHQLSVTLDSSAAPMPYSRVGQFTDEDGQEHDVLDGYRYSIKAGWRAIPSLSNLDFVRAAGGLDAAERRQMAAFIGSRTITAPIEEIDAFAAPILARHADLFEPGEGSSRVPRWSEEAYRRQIDRLAGFLRQDFEHLPAPAGGRSLRVLDVGCGRGLSTAAFEKLGHRAIGLDSEYQGGAVSTLARGMRERLSRLHGRDDMFVSGDITRCPEIPDESFDLIHSASCLEHVADIDSAFSEMIRILRPGGVMLHRYNPFWAENGGHAFGILDSPWLHAALSPPDFDRFLREWRPYEAPLALAWTRGALNRRITINAMQHALSSAGFGIHSWRESLGQDRNLGRLSSDLLRGVQRRYPDALLADLLATDIAFVAIKPSG